MDELKANGNGGGTQEPATPATPPMAKPEGPFSAGVSPNSVGGVEKQAKKYAVGGITGKGWVPGKSGNPAGRPKHKTLMEAVREVLAENFPQPMPDGSYKTNLEVLARVIVQQSIKGKFPFAKELFERIDGKVPLTLTGPNGAPLSIGTTVDVNIDFGKLLPDMSVEEVKAYDALLAKLAERTRSPAPALSAKNEGTGTPAAP